MVREILIVDDEKIITDSLSTLLQLSLSKCKIITCNCPIEALRLIEERKKEFDLIISDFLMPKLNGIQFLINAKLKCPNAILIILTGYADKENAIKGINMVGLYYYLEKPWNNDELIKVISNGLEKKALSDKLHKNSSEAVISKYDINKAYEELKKEYDNLTSSIIKHIITLADAVDYKDKYYSKHNRRVGSLSKKIGLKLGISDEDIRRLEIGGIIHDIGKLSIPYGIINKKARVNDKELEFVKNAPIIGENIIKSFKCLSFAKDMVRHHHEKINGSGYPDGLKGDEISLKARIIGVCDIFDALYSERPYRVKLPFKTVKEIIESEVKKGELDEKIVHILFQLIDNGELDDIYGKIE